MKRTVDQRIAGIAGTARESARGGSDIVDLRFYVRDAGHSMGGEVIALNRDGSTVKDLNGDEIALPLAKHEDAGTVVQDVVDRVQAARAARYGRENNKP